MAVEARNYQVLMHYIVEALIVTAIGSSIGIALTKAVIFIIDRIPLHGQLFQFSGKPTPVLSSLVIAVVIITLGIIGFLSGLFPAHKAANIDPAEALRYE